MASSLSDLIKTYRVKAGITQKQFADILGVSQVTVSRIESGVLIPSEDVLLKINSLLKKDMVKPERNLRLNEKTDTKNFFNKKLNLSYYKSTFGLRSGDALRFSSIEDTLYLLVGDMVGHGDEASIMSSSIEFGFHQAVGIMKNFATPQALMRSFEDGIQKTRDTWSGPPSILVASIDMVNSVLEINNKGLPQPLIFNSLKDKSESRKWQTETTKHDSLIEIYREQFSKGDTFLFYSDGILDSANVSKSAFQENFSTLARTFKGDSKAILKNLVEDYVNKEPIDDITLMVISISR